MPRDKARELKRMYRKGSVILRLMRLFHFEDNGLRARLFAHWYRGLLSVFTANSEFEVKDRTEPPPDLVGTERAAGAEGYYADNFNSRLGSIRGVDTFNRSLSSQGPFSPPSRPPAGSDGATELRHLDSGAHTVAGFGCGGSFAPSLASLNHHYESPQFPDRSMVLRAFKLDAIFATLLQAAPKRQRTAQHNHAARLVNLCSACFVLLVLTVYQAELTNLLIDTESSGAEASTMAELTSKGLTACTWEVVTADLTTIYPGLRTVLINTSATPATEMAGGAQLLATGAGGGCDVIIDDRATLLASQAAGETGAPQAWCDYTVTDETVQSMQSAFPIADKYLRPMNYWMDKILELGRYGGTDNWLLANYEKQLGDGAVFSLSCDSSSSSSSSSTINLDPTVLLSSESDRGSSGIAGPAPVLMLSAVAFSVVQLATRELSDTPELYRAYCAPASVKMGCTSCQGCDEGGDGGCGRCGKCCRSPCGVRPVGRPWDADRDANDNWSHTQSASQHVPPPAVAEKGGF